MRKFEVLSPAGDINNFKIAIQSGADAVYFGLNKFNARLKADNVNLDNLEELVNFAHIRGVNVYVTINTLLSNAELKELIPMVEECLKVGVDAFIVQDLGVISILRSVFPGIVLHGSTQMGVHNVRGARVAKEMGLSRVVLSREVTIDDIIEIKNNVDIELEVFVQGAMCVCFSGNCYMSSLKHNASGNRGLCKQLCRLPYTLESKNASKKGFILSPRDNCMIDYISKLCEIGVDSFKIEGRLRRAGYVATATRIYRDSIDNYNNLNQDFIKKSKANLKKVFSRGEFTPGYFESKDIIDTKFNNHMGEKIGKVVSIQKFKDLYKITLNVSMELHSGDGLKVVDGDNIVSLGVGNIEKTGKNQVIYSKYKVEKESLVYRVLDSEFENDIVDRTRKRIIDFEVKLKTNECIELKAKVDGFEVCDKGDIVKEAINKPLTQDSVIAQISKVGDLFNIGKIDIEMDNNAFMPVSELNSIRRIVVDNIVTKIIDSYKIDIIKGKIPQIQNSSCSLDSIAIVDEDTSIDKLKSRYDALILSPKLYSVKVIEKFYKEYTKHFNSPLIINLPIIALKKDFDILDKIVEFARINNMVVLANNIYALDYIKDGVTIWAGSNMNITNDFARSSLIELGVKEVIASIENWYGSISDAYKLAKGKPVLMTFAHCPNITLNKSNRGLSGDSILHCGQDKCCDTGSLKLSSNAGEFNIRKHKIYNCYFELVDDYIIDKNCKNSIEDLRGVVCIKSLN